jgi:hypothetical protein
MTSQSFTSPNMLPGEFQIVIGQAEDAIHVRSLGLQLRDTVLILMPGPREVFAFLFRVPLEGTVAQNVLKHGVGGLNIDACRVAGQAEVPGSRRVYRRFDDKGDKPELEPPPPPHAGGRWPSNLLLVHGPDCVNVGTKVVKGSGINSPEHCQNGSWSKGTFAQDAWTKTSMKRSCVGHTGANGTETVASWQCQPNCPVGLLDEQVGVLRSGKAPETGFVRNSDKHRNTYAKFQGNREEPTALFGDSGGASRFYPQFTRFAEALDWLTRLIQPPLKV